MDLNSSLGKICLGDNVIEISSDKIEGSGDWNSLEYHDMAGSKGKKVVNTFSFYRMEIDKIRRSFLRLAKGIVDFGNGVIKISQNMDPFLMMISEDNRKSSDDWDKNCFDFNFDDIPQSLENDLPTFVCKMGTKFEGKVNENALADTGLDMNTMPYRIYDQLGRDDLKNEDRWITMINHTQAEVMGKLSNVPCQVGVATLIIEFLILVILIDRDSLIVVCRGFLRTISGMINTLDRIFSTFDGFCHQTFHAARLEYMRNVESDSDDEEEYVIKRNKFGAPIYGPRPAPYLNYTNPKDRSSAIQTVTNPFRKISIWKKVVSFLGSLPAPLKQVNWKPEYKGSYTKEEEATGQWRTEIRITDPYGNIYLQGFTTKKTDRKLLEYHKLSDIMSPN
ncbi:hypothetical protein Tco_1217699 [Tanacetum coccineum]